MKILIVGPWQWPQYEAAVADAMRGKGVRVDALATSSFFRGRLGRMQQAVPLPLIAIRQLNRAVLGESRRLRPDMVLFWRPTHILPATLRRLSRMGVRTASYNNDDPFGQGHHADTPWHQRWLWTWYRRCLPLFDLNFFYRPVNCTEARAAGARHAALLLPYFIPAQDRPLQLDAAESERFGCDIVFVGHYEADGRDDLVRALLDAGLSVKLWGDDTWNRAELAPKLGCLQPVRPALGDDYRRALAGAKVCLCLLSRLNRDTYTRRCFEIPACGRPMLAERTADLMAMFREDEEACFFGAGGELVEKARLLLDNTDLRERIAAAGLRRVWADGHSVDARAGELLAAFESVIADQAAG